MNHVLSYTVNATCITCGKQWESQGGATDAERTKKSAASHARNNTHRVKLWKTVHKVYGA